MQIIKSNLDLIPEMNYTKFEVLDNQTQITAWDGPNLVAQLCIPGEINKNCTVGKKTISMMKLLCKGEDSIDVNVNSTFSISSGNGKYKGGIVAPIYDMTINFDESKMEVYPYGADILSKASDFTNSKVNKKILQGINIGKNGVVATDSFKVYFYGQANKGVENITIDIEFVKRITRNGFKEICSDGRRVLVVDNNGINWYSTILEGEYPDLSKIIKVMGGELDFDFTILKSAIDLAIASLNKSKDDSKIEAVDIVSDAKEIIVSSDDYRMTFSITTIPFSLCFTVGSIELLNSLNAKVVYYSSKGQPLFARISDMELACFISIVKEGK